MFKTLAPAIGSLASALSSVWQERTPRQLRRELNPLYMSSPLANQLTVDRIHSIVAAAQQGEVADLFTLYREMELADHVVQSAIATRKLAVLNDSWTILPFDKTAPEDVLAADFIRGQLADFDGFIDACNHLLSASMWPVAVVEKRFAATGGGYRLSGLRPVPPELLDYRDRYLRIKRAGTDGDPTDVTDFPDPQRYIVHRGHLLNTPDHWGGPMRSLIFWFLFGAMGRDWWARFLDRFGSPFFVGYYDSNDQESRYSLERAFSEATKLFGIVATRETEIEIQQASSSDGGKSFSDFHEAAKREKLMAILGQTLSAQSDPTGLGSGVANLQGQVRADYRSWDALKLGDTLRTQVFRQILRLNGLAGAAPRIIWGATDSAEVTQGLLQAIDAAGLEVDDEGIGLLSERTGLPLRRKTVPTPPPIAGLMRPALPFSAAVSGNTLAGIANEAVDRQAAADFGPGLGLDLADLFTLASAARSRRELRDLLTARLTGSPPVQAAKVLEEASFSAAVNALGD